MRKLNNLRSLNCFLFSSTQSRWNAALNLAVRRLQMPSFKVKFIEPDDKEPFRLFNSVSCEEMTTQRLLGRTISNMADGSEQDLANNASVDHETLWKGKYFTLLKHCRQIEQVIIFSL